MVRINDKSDKNHPMTLPLLFFVFLFVISSAGCAHQGGKAPRPSPGQKPDHGAVLAAGDEKPLESEGREEDPLDAFDSGEDLDLWDEESEEESISVADPLSPWNRAMFHLNDKLYFWVLKPVAKGYKAVTPSPFRVGIRNFFHNITAPIRIVNCVLQGKVQTAETELARFLINSTVGGLGFGDLAKNNPKFEKPPAEDLGQTLATYGVGNGIYIVWPLMGPSTLRDSVGMIGDYFLNPVTYAEMSSELSLGITGLKTVNETSFRIGNYESLKDAAIEPYESLRNGYIQYRDKKARNKEDGKSERRYDNLIKEWIR